MGVWEVVLVAECMRKTQKKPIRGRWMDVNKVDDQMEVYVAMELKQRYGGATRDGLFAAMPPPEGGAVTSVICCQQTESQISAQAHVHRHIQGYLHAASQALSKVEVSLFIAFITGSTSDCEITSSRSSSYTVAQSASRTTSCIIAGDTETVHVPRSAAERLRGSLRGLTTGSGHKHINGITLLALESA